MPFEEGKSGNEEAKFKPGQSGNPNGRPKGKSVTTILNELLEKGTSSKVAGSEAVKEFLENDRSTNAEAIAATLLYNALTKNDLKAIKEILDRTEGKSVQKTNVKIESIPAPIFNVLPLKDGD